MLVSSAPLEIVELELVHVHACEVVLDQERNNRSYGDGGTGVLSEGIANDNQDFSDEQLRDDIRAHGVLQPIGVRSVESVVHCLYGYRRLRACRAIDEHYPVPCILHAQTGDAIRDDFDANAINLRENLNRRALKPFEVAEALYRMHHLCPELTTAELGESIGLCQSYTSHLLKIRRDAIPQLWQLFVSYGLRFNASVGWRDLLPIVSLPKTEQLQAWRALIDERTERKKHRRKKQGFKARPSTIRRWIEDVENLPPEDQRGARHALRVVLGLERWRGKHQPHTRRPKNLNESAHNAHGE